MRLIESGRFVFPEAPRTAREFAGTNLMSVHSRLGRLAAIAGRARVKGELQRTEDVSPPPPVAEKAELLEIISVVSTELSDTDDWLLLRDYSKESRARSILFTFRGGELATVVKMRDVRGGGRTLRNESEVLKYLFSSFSEGVRSVVPRVVEHCETGNYEVLELSPVAGRPLWISMQRSFRPLRAHAEHLAAAGAWLGGFHREAAMVNAGASEKVAEYANAGQLVVVHGDLWARNILFDQDQVSGVVDWERATLGGERWHDLFTLPLLFVMNEPSWRPRDRLERFEEAFIEDSRNAAVVRRYLDVYLERSGLDGSLLRPMFEAFLATGENEAGKGEHGWRRGMPWTAMLEQFRNAGRTVFSG